MKGLMYLKEIVKFSNNEIEKRNYIAAKVPFLEKMLILITY